MLLEDIRWRYGEIALYQNRVFGQWKGLSCIESLSDNVIGEAISRCMLWNETDNAVDIESECIEGEDAARL